MKLMLMIFVLNILSYQSLYALNELKIKKNRLVVVEDVVKDLDSQANRVLSLSENGDEPIYILLDTPGGSVIGGLKLIRAIERAKVRGIRVVCMVDGQSMSMGMHIMAACNHNFALPTSLLMFHKIAMYSMFYKIEENKTSVDIKQLKLLGDLLDKKLEERLKISKAQFDEYMHNEYIQYASEFVSPSFVTVVDDYKLVN